LRDNIKINYLKGDTKKEDLVLASGCDVNENFFKTAQAFRKRTTDIIKMSLTKDHFSWIVPFGKKEIIGCGTKGNPRKLFREIFGKHEYIHCGKPVSHYYFENKKPSKIEIGERRGLVTAAGEGNSSAILSAYILSRILRENLEYRDVFLSYEEELKKNFSFMRHGYKIYDLVSNFQFVEALKEAELYKRKIEERLGTKLNFRDVLNSIVRRV